MALPSSPRPRCPTVSAAGSVRRSAPARLAWRSGRQGARGDSAAGLGKIADPLADCRADAGLILVEAQACTVVGRGTGGWFGCPRGRSPHPCWRSPVRGSSCAVSKRSTSRGGPGRTALRSARRPARLQGSRPVQGRPALRGVRTAAVALDAHGTLASTVADQKCVLVAAGRPCLGPRVNLSAFGEVPLLFLVGVPVMQCVPVQRQARWRRQGAPSGRSAAAARSQARPPAEDPRGPQPGRTGPPAGRFPGWSARRGWSAARRVPPSRLQQRRIASARPLLPSVVLVRVSRAAP